MKIKLIELRNSMQALGKIYNSEIPLPLAHKVSIFIKSLEPHLKAIDETQTKLIEKYEIKDVKKEMAEKSDVFKRLEGELAEYLVTTEIDVSDIGITWNDLIPYENRIIISGFDKDLLSLYIK